MIEKPHFTGWRPLFENGFDLQYAPVMQLALGKGRVTWCGLDLEDQSPADPAAEVLSRNRLHAVGGSPLTPRANKVVYLGGEEGAKFLRTFGLNFETKPGLESFAQLSIIGPDAKVPAPLYHPDYREEFDTGDEPCRSLRW